MHWHRCVIGLVGLAIAMLVAVPVALAQAPVKIGLIMPYSGQFADTATQMDNAIKLYVQQHGDSVAGRKIELIRRDTGGVAPDVAKRLAQAGCRVVSSDRDAAALAAAKAEFEPALAQAVDVTDLKAVERTFEAAAKAFGKIDIIVNNAGVNGPTVPTWEYPPEAWDRVLAVDLTGVFYCAREAFRVMKARV